MHNEKKKLAWTLENNLHLKENATAVATELKAVVGGKLPRDLKSRFLEVRAVLFERGLYDPILVRFDSATVPQAPMAEIADQLALIAESL